MIAACKNIFENDINTVDFQENSPLHFACLTGNLRVIRVLLSFQGSHNGGTNSRLAPGAGAPVNGIDLCKFNKEKLMPIHCAIARKHYLVVHELLS